MVRVGSVAGMGTAEEDNAMPAQNPDRNFLFGILALQMGFLDRDALVAALHAWLDDKTKSLGDILVDRQALQPTQRDELDALVHQLFDCHRNNGEKSLPEDPGPTILREDLPGLTKQELQDLFSFTPLSSETGRLGPMPSCVPMPNRASGSRYKVLHLHNKGGLGEVFLALDQELNRQVALKEIQRFYAADPQSCGRFVREAEITGGLEHPGIVPVYGLGQYADGRPFYAMRFIQGETLKDAIARYHQTSADGPAARSPEFELRALLTRFIAVCNTIAYAHSRGVIHRDIDRQLSILEIRLLSAHELLKIPYSLLHDHADTYVNSIFFTTRTMLEKIATGFSVCMKCKMGDTEQ